MWLTEKNYVVLRNRTGEICLPRPKKTLLIKVIGTMIKSNAENILKKITTDYNFPPQHINKMTEDLEEGYL